LLVLLSKIATAMQFARLTVVAVAVLLPALVNGGKHGLKNIVETANANGNFKTLLAGVEKAKLTATLSGPGNFTVFAPTDTAFAALLASMNMTAAMVMNMPQLPGMLMYHVLPSVVKSTDLSNGMKATTLAKAQITVTIAGKVVKVNDATVTTADVMCSNGVIHIIDKVLVAAPAAAATTTAAASISGTTGKAAAGTAGTTAKAADATGTKASTVTAAASTASSAGTTVAAVATVASAASAPQFLWASVVSAAISAFVFA